MLAELGVALGLVFILEGLCYALFPDSMKRMLELFRHFPTDKLRWLGIIAMLTGPIVVWLVKFFSK